MTRTLHSHPRTTVAKRAQRGGARPAPAPQEPGPAVPLERHSGEGSASALETLQKMESRRRLPGRPAEPAPEDDPGS